MGSSTLDGRPTPVAPVGRYPGCAVVAACRGCGRTARLRVAALLAGRRVAADTPFHRVGERLRCRACGGAGRIAEVVGWSRR